MRPDLALWASDNVGLGQLEERGGKYLKEVALILSEPLNNVCSPVIPPEPWVDEEQTLPHDQVLVVLIVEYDRGQVARQECEVGEGNSGRTLEP